jgi:imidazolonepropionase-like amidohydrolase
LNEACPGTLEADKLADIIAIKRNLLEDISLMQHVPFEMKDGRVFKMP